MKTVDEKFKRKIRFIYICLVVILVALLALIMILLFSYARFMYPHATFTHSPITPLVGETVTFNASASYDPDGIIVNYTWSFGDKNITSMTTPIITHVYMATGNYTVTLVVTDNNGLTDSTINFVRVGKYPIAHFTYSPDKPVVGEPVNFDASASTPNGGHIVAYEWDFGDGEKISATSPIIIHVYTRSGPYNVTLSITDSEKLQNTTSKIVNVMKSVMIDMYTQHPYPYGGQGLNLASDAFAPQDEVTLSANVTFKGNPVENKLVVFEVFNPTETLIIRKTATTASNGIAVTKFTIPWQVEKLSTKIFGIWLAYASTEVVKEKANDTLTFEVGWLVELVRLETCDYAGNVKTSFAHDENITFKVYLKNIAMVAKTVVVTINAYDELNVPFGLVESPNFVVPANSSMSLLLDLKIPKWAFVGNATAYANAFTDLPINGGLPYCPQISSMFFITWEAPIPPPPPEGWVVELVSLETCNSIGNAKTSFVKEEDVYFKLHIKNNALVDKNVTVTIVIFDELNVPLGQLTLTDLVVPANSSMSLLLDLKIPKWAFTGNATAYANAFTDLPINGGLPYCPQISAAFIIADDSGDTV